MVSGQYGVLLNMDCCENNVIRLAEIKNNKGNVVTKKDKEFFEIV